MYLTTRNKFKSCTIDREHRNETAMFMDVRIPNKAKTRSGGLLASASFIDGNWNSNAKDPEFTGSSHVISIVNVGYSRGGWQVTFTCKTGKSSYGTEFHAYGYGNSYGDINLYWWWTSGGSAPYKWKFTLGDPPGGEALGTVSFRNT